MPLREQIEELAARQPERIRTLTLLCSLSSGGVGTRFTFKQCRELKKQLDKVMRERSPFAVTLKDPGLREAR